MTDELDKYYQAHTLSRIRGVVFNFLRKNRKNRNLKDGIYGERVCIHSEREKIEAFKSDDSKPFLLLLHPTHGQPGSLAYRLLMALERRLNKTMESGVEATNTELLRMIGLKPNTNRRAELDTALDQLQYTFVEYHSRPFFKTRKNIQGRFSLIEYTVDKTKKKPVYRIKLASVITSELIDKRKFQVYNFIRIASLEPIMQNFALCVLDALTRRKIRYDKSSETGTWDHNKAYDAVCKDWLGGLTPRPSHSRAWDDHLKIRIETLVGCGILHKESHLSKSANDPTPELPFNSNLILYPGAGFLKDHELLHPKKVTSESEDDELREQADAILAIFKAAYLFERLPHDSDRRGAAHWIKEYGFDKAKHFVAWGAQQANNSGYKDLKYITGLKTFRERYEELSKHAASPCEIVEPTKDEIVRYESYVQTVYDRLYSKLTDEHKIDYQAHFDMLVDACPTPDQVEFRTFAHGEALRVATSVAPKSLLQYVAKQRDKEAKIASPETND